MIDLEATGRCPESGGVWEIACVAVRGGEIVGDFATSVWPGRRYLNVENLALVEKLTGIAPADLLPVLLRAATPNVAMAKTALLKWISRQAGFSYEWAHLSEGVPPRPVVLTSFNTQFDRRFLDSRDWNIAWALAATTGVQIEWDLCVMLEARTHMLQAGAIAAGRSPSLADACRHFGIPFEVKHRALPDARAAAQLAIALGLTTATTTTAKQAA